MTGHCIFTAPYEFLPEELILAYTDTLPTIFCEINERSELLKDEEAYAWIVNPGQAFRVDSESLGMLPSIKVVVTPSTGTNHIDLEECEERGVTVYSLLDNRECLDTISASAEFTFLLLMAVLRRFGIAITEVSGGRWRENEDRMRGRELSDLRVGLVGFGRIGRRMFRYCSSFGAEVVCHDPYVMDTEVPNLSLEEIFKTSDVVCVCCALTAETSGLIGRSLLESLKQEASLINTSRGEVIVETDLAEVLALRPDLRVGLDVLTGEITGTQWKSPLLPFKDQGQVLVTPHIAGATLDSQTKAARCALHILRNHMGLPYREI
tara:strand:- start:5762 stop:6727 length:966 start_codon:yes stop_codon:yes gene_type:complete